MCYNITTDRPNIKGVETERKKSSDTQSFKLFELNKMQLAMASKIQKYLG